MEFIPVWYRPYFKLAVLKDIRPSEQVTLKWSAVDDWFIHVELSRVWNLVKAELKTAASNQRIDIRPSMKKVVEEQQTQMANLTGECMKPGTPLPPGPWQQGSPRSGWPGPWGT